MLIAHSVGKEVGMGTMLVLWEKDYGKTEVLYPALPVQGDKCVWEIFTEEVMNRAHLGR